MIGLILGETQFGSLIIEKLKLLKKKFIIIDISKNKIFSKNRNSFSLSVGQIGKAISILKKNNCKKLIFAGKVSRPNFKKTKFDLKTLVYLPKILKFSKKGDALIIKQIIKIFNNEGFKIIPSTFFNPELTLKKGTYTIIKPNKVDKKDMLKGKKIINDLSKQNIGQGAIVKDGFVIAIEGQHGTDAMLNKAHILIKRLYKRRVKSGILIKFPKLDQDLRIDLPAIGIKTIKKCSKIGLKGIYVKANQNIILNKSKCLSLANKNKMFLCAI